MKIAFDAHAFTRPPGSTDRALRVMLLAAEHVNIETELWSQKNFRGDLFSYADKARLLSGHDFTSDADFYWSPDLRLFPLDIPSIATFHNISPLLRNGENMISRWKRKKEYRKAVAPVVKKADHLVTHTDFARQAVSRTVSRSKRKLSTVPLFVDPTIKPKLGTTGKVLLDEQNLTPGFILCVGRMQKHKNWGRLMRAYAKLPHSLKAAHPLVFAGSSKRAERDAEKLAQKLHISDNVHLTGIIEDKMLYALYGGAALLAYPSLKEGFGLPALEAMACGIPVVASNTTCLPEILGDAPVYINPGSVDDISQAMETLLTDTSLRSHHISGGIDRAGQFNAERTGIAMLEVLNKL